METTATFTVSIIGKLTGNPYNGQFVAKMILTRRDNFLADAERRRIIGPSPEGTFPAPKLHGEAYILGLLRAHLVEAPDWWKDSDFGLDLNDDNVADEIMQIITSKMEEYRGKVADQAEKALSSLRKNTKKAE